MEASQRGTARRLAALGAATALLLALCAGPARAADTVTITGNAYAFIFGGNEDRLEGATIGIAEIPGLTAVAGPNGAYELEVPDDTTITPFAVMPGYYTTHVQTFHTRGKDLNQVNFQMPELSVYGLLAAVVGAERNPDGSLASCGIVSTFFQKEGRSFLDFDDFHDFRPHGVEGSTATISPAAGRQLYFNESVIPDPQQESSSRDGGVLWVDVPAGAYQVTGQNPTTRHAPFVATCEPGRLVNANPPWGLYEMARTEEPNPAVLPADPPLPPAPQPVDASLDASLAAAKVVKRGKRRTLRVTVTAGEPVLAEVTAKQRKRRLSKRADLPAGTTRVQLNVPRRFKGSQLRMNLALTDAAGNSRTSRASLSLPRVPAKPRPGRR